MVTPASRWAMNADTWLLVTLLWPLACTFLMLVFGWPGKRRKRQPSRWPGWVAVGSVAVSFAVSLACVILSHTLFHDTTGRPLHVTFGEWIPGFGVTLGLMLDGLSSVLLLLVECIGLMVLLYSIHYMRREADQTRYYGSMLFFLAMMKLLILADNYLLLFAGWEGVGLASYLLIGYHFERWKAAQAATKAFVVNRIGDAGLLVGIFALYQSCGSLSFDAIAANASAIPHRVAVAICAALLIGALGKSAQIPLHVWLPDAMEGPTPVSALIHSATMVCAGVYLVARSSELFSLTPEVSAGVAILGAATALFAATVALVEDDIKRVLAYSTISQIGFMFLALGAGAYWVAIFHLFTHAFFKSLLFLGAGSVIHALNGSQNLKEMGGLRTKMPATFATMAVAAGSLAGLPGSAAFFSKDAVLGSVLYAANGTPLFLIALGTSILTACYSGRLLFLVFFGPSRPRGSAAPAHESPPLMLVPMLVLSAGCVLAGFLFLPVDWRTWPLMLLSGVIAITGMWLAYHYYVSKPEARGALDQRFAGLTKVLRNRWYVDAIYEQQIIDGLVLRAAHGAALFDSSLIDGTVNGAAFLTRKVSRFSRWIDRYVIDGLVRSTSGVIHAFSTPARAMQSGFVQTYAFLFVVGLLAALGYFLVHAR
jgi:NADH-quinone oxidoreductase subunit L